MCLWGAGDSCGRGTWHMAQVLTKIAGNQNGHDVFFSVGFFFGSLSRSFCFICPPFRVFRPFFSS